MPRKLSYGERTSNRFELEQTPAIVRTLRKDSRFAATRLTCETANQGMNTPVPAESAYVVVVKLKDFMRGELWIDDRVVPQAGFKSNDVGFYDLRCKTLAYVEDPFDALHFYVPHNLLHQVADDAGVSRIDELSVPLGVGLQDPTLAHLARGLLPALDHTDQVGSFFVDHFAFALGAHLTHTYGRRSVVLPSRGGLSKQEENLAKQLLSASLEKELSLADIAHNCGLPIGRFIRAFRQSTGMSPYKWSRWHRIERAKKMLLTSNLSIAQIAFALHFVDQSHFTRVFSAWVGTSPGNWRRVRRE